MFTGIITHLGFVQERSATGMTIKIPADLTRQLKTSDSIAVNGVCLTVTKAGADSISVDIMPETWKKTALGTLSNNDLVNLELPLKIDSRFAGHIVQGHVDGVGTIQKIIKEKNSHLFSIKVPYTLTKYFVEKGSIAVNGISLTIINVDKNSFSVGIIPFTFSNTILHQAKIGDQVNIELDILGKYVEKLTKG